MQAIDDGFEALAINMGVNLRGRDALMAEEKLHGTEVGAAFEEVRREGVAERVRRKRRDDSGVAGASAKQFPKTLARHRASARREEKRALGRASDESWSRELKVGAKGVERDFADGHDAFLAAFPAAAHDAARFVDAVHGERHEFADAEPGRVKEFEHRAVAQRRAGFLGRRREEAFDVIERKCMRQAAPGWWNRDFARGIVGCAELVVRIAVKCANSREGPRN